MSETVLATKLHIPPVRAEFVRRPRLTAKLELAVNHKLTLLIAPAGFGKTTLLAEWIRDVPHAAGWLSLDEQDNNLMRFLRYLIHALRRNIPDAGAESLALLNSSHLPHRESILTTLANEIAMIPDTCIVILDDYHVINNRSIHDAVDFLLTHQPPNICLAIASRAEPPLNLARLRGRAQLLELDSAYLRFTAIEAERFLRDVMHLSLTSKDRITLEMRTEGWITGLQLTALSLQSQDDKSAFLSAFSGTNRYIADFLFDEVLRRQSEDIQWFLLCTSVVEEMCGGLCDALLDTSDSQQMLEAIEKAQLFIVPLDDKRQWYRYHQLFAGMLRHHLTQVHPDQVQRLHRQASGWYEQQDMIEDAIRHGLQGQDFERCADLIEAAFQRRDWVRQDMHHLLDWFDALPVSTVHARPRLMLAHAWLLFEIYADRWENIEHNLTSVERILATPAAKNTYSDTETRLILAQVDLLRVNHARHSGESLRVIALCQQALERLPENEIYIRSGVVAHLASAYESLGNMQQASESYAESIRMCRTAENIDGLLFATARLIDVYGITGQFRLADNVLVQARAYDERRSGPDTGLVRISIGSIYRERNQFDEAKASFETGIKLCRPFEAWRAAVISGVIGIAHVLAAEGRIDEAIDTLLEAEKHSADILDGRRLRSNLSRLYLAGNGYDDAARWAISRGIPTRKEIKFVHEFDALTIVRILLAQASLEAQGGRVVKVSNDPLREADDLLGHIHQASLSGGRMARIVEVAILRALLFAARQEIGEALKQLQKALTLAEPEKYIRLFVDEGPPMYQLLTTLRTRPISSPISAGYLNALRDAFPQSVRQSVAESSLTGGTLTESERNTLRLLASERSIEEIAAELSVAVSTVRTYTKRIYSKLDAHSRAEAVYRARELDLL